MNGCFGRPLRLTKKSEFIAVFGFRCSARTAHFAVFAKPNTLSVSRLGMTISRRVAPLAVDRNYMKRVIREIFRRHRHEFSGVDMVVSARLAFASGKYLSVETELLAGWSQARSKCLASCKP